MRPCTHLFCGRLCAVLVGGFVLAQVATTHAAVVREFDAAVAGAGVDPTGVSPAWQRFGTPMTNNGSFLLQDNTADDPTTSSGEYLAPPVPGLMALASGQYGVEVKVRPLTDVPFLGNSHFGNAYVFWSDDSFSYNITIDKDTDDAGPGTTGGIKYGQNSMADAVTGIDWSQARSIFVGYVGTAPFGDFTFYVDGVFAATVSAGSMARSGSFARDAIDFGDGTTGQGIDVAVEWYRVALHDSAAVPEPAGILSGAAALTVVLRRRRLR